ncbi:MAG: transcriptional repressor LexA [Alphaproteobacteria bacterium]|nr:transcriptional repressor LexA [Alphaproteobacteria bacterium]
MLTKKQYELLLFINKRLNEQGVSPSFDEMKAALGLRSKSGIHRLITGLEERGFIRRLPHRARALEIARLPENLAPAAAASAAPARPVAAGAHVGSNGNGIAGNGNGGNGGTFRPNVIQGDFRPGLSGVAAPPSANDAVSLPLYGRIAAGQPIEALADTSNTVEVPASLLGRGEHFALEVAGDSMVDAGIFDGDTVLVRRDDAPENGAIVVALIDDNEVTLKRLRRNKGSIALEPANKAYETRIFGPDRVRIQGRVVGLIRRF